MSTLSNTPEDKKKKTGIIIGSIIGAVVLIAIIILIIVWFNKRKTKINCHEYVNSRGTLPEALKEIYLKECLGK